MADLRSREDYLADLQKLLVATLQELYSVINKNVAAAYGLALLMVLFSWGKVMDQELELLGAKIPLQGEDILFTLPSIMGVLYILILYQIQRAATCLREVQNSSRELRSLNDNARPIDVQDMSWLAAGVPGLVLAISGVVGRALSRTSPAARLHTSLEERGLATTLLQLPGWLGRTFLWITVGLTLVIATAAILYLPLILVVGVQYSSLDSVDNSWIYPLIVGEVAVAVGVLIVALKLMATYLAEPLRALISDLRALPDAAISGSRVRLISFFGKLLSFLGVPLGAAYERALDAVVERVLIARYAREQPTIEYIAITNSLDALQRAAEQQFHSSDQKFQQELEEVRSAVEKIEDPYAKRQVYARAFLKLLSWEQLQSLGIVPAKLSQEDVPNPSEILRTASNYLLQESRDGVAILDRIIDSTIKKLSKTGADDEIRADLAYQLRDTLTVTGRVRRKLLWLCLQRGFNLKLMQDEGLLPPDLVLSGTDKN